MWHPPKYQHHRRLAALASLVATSLSAALPCTAATQAAHSAEPAEAVATNSFDGNLTLNDLTPVPPPAPVTIRYTPFGPTSYKTVVIFSSLFGSHVDSVALDRVELLLNKTVGLILKVQYISWKDKAFPDGEVLPAGTQSIASIDERGVVTDFEDIDAKDDAHTTDDPGYRDALNASVDNYFLEFERETRRVGEVIARSRGTTTRRGTLVSTYVLAGIAYRGGSAYYILRPDELLADGKPVERLDGYAIINASNGSMIRSEVRGGGVVTSVTQVSVNAGETP